MAKIDNMAVVINMATLTSIIPSVKAFMAGQQA